MRSSARTGPPSCTTANQSAVGSDVAKVQSRRSGSGTSKPTDGARLTGAVRAVAGRAGRGPDLGAGSRRRIRGARFDGRDHDDHDRGQPHSKVRGKISADVHRESTMADRRHRAMPIAPSQQADSRGVRHAIAQIDAQLPDAGGEAAGAERQLVPPEQRDESEQVADPPPPEAGRSAPAFP